MFIALSYSISPLPSSSTCSRRILLNLPAVVVIHLFDKLFHLTHRDFLPQFSQQNDELIGPETPPSVGVKQHESLAKFFDLRMELWNCWMRKTDYSWSFVKSTATMFTYYFHDHTFWKGIPSTTGLPRPNVGEGDSFHDRTSATIRWGRGFLPRPCFRDQTLCTMGIPSTTVLPRPYVDSPSASRRFFALAKQALATAPREENLPVPHQVPWRVSAFWALVAPRPWPRWLPRPGRKALPLLRRRGAWAALFMFVVWCLKV